MKNYCSICKDIKEFKEIEQQGTSINIFDQKENIYAGQCCECSNKNIFQIDILTKNYENNIFLWKLSNKKILNIFLPKFIPIAKSNLILQDYFNKVYFYKISIKNKDIKVLEKTLNPNKIGLYVMLPINNNIKFDKLIFFEIIESNIIFINNKQLSNKNIIIAKK